MVGGAVGGRDGVEAPNLAGRQLALSRKRHRTSQQQLARAMRVSLDTVRSWETGRLRLSADTARRAAMALDGRPEEIEGLCNAVRAETVLADLLQTGRGFAVCDRPATSVDLPLRQALLQFFETGRWAADMDERPQTLAAARQSLLDAVSLAHADGAARSIPPELFGCLARAAGTAPESWKDDVKRLLRAAFDAVADPPARREVAIALAELGCDELLARYLEATEQDDGDARADLAWLAHLSGEAGAGPPTVRMLLDLLAACRRDGRRPDRMAALHLRSLWQVLVQCGPAALESLVLARDLDAEVQHWSSRDDCPAARREAARLRGEFARASASIAEAYATFAPARRKARTVLRQARPRAPRWLDVDEVEARGFVGRDAQFERMRDLLDARRNRSALVYVHGPAGVGKSALLRAYRRLAVARGVPAVLVDGGVAEPSRQGFLRAAAAAFGQPGTPPERALRLVVRHAARGGLLLLVDAYDELMLLDRWLRAEVFAAVGPGTVAVLAGRRPPRDLWPADPTWCSRLLDIRLADLPAGDAEDLLQRRGVAPPALRQEAVAIAGGRPLFLVLAAQALVEQRAGGAAGDAAEDGGGEAGADGTAGEMPGRPGGEAPTAALLGLLLHPESPGHPWTFGSDASPPERLLAAACMVRTFDQAVLEAMAGAETVVGGWSRLLDLPVLAKSGRCYALHDAARSRAAELIERERPWLARAWRQRAMAYHLDRARRDPQARASAWPEVAHLARRALWHSWLHPESEAREGWRFERGLRVEDVPELSQCADAIWRDVLGLSPELLESCHAELRQLAGVFRAHFVLARDRRGAVIGFHAHVPLVRETRDLLLGTVSPGLYLRTLAPDRLSAWEGRTLCACFLATRNVEGELYRALLREFCADFYRYDRVVGVAPQTHGGRAEGGIGHLMSMLGMRRVPGFRVCQPDVALPLYAWRLDIAPLGYAEWLRRITTEEVGISLEERLQATREALGAFHDPAVLCAGGAARHFARRFGEPTEQRLRSWLLDALADAAPRGGDLVRAYFVERAGTHERIAERLGLPRRTYFDRLHRGLEATASTLLA